MVDPKIILHFAFKYRVNILPQVGRICKAARIKRLGCLLKGGSKGRARLKRGCGSSNDRKSYRRGNSGVDFVLDNLISLIIKDCLKERYNTLDVKVTRVNC